MAVDMTVFGGEAVVGDVYVAMASIVLSTIFSIYQFIMFVIRIAKKDFKGVAGRLLLLLSFVLFMVINFLLYLFILGFTGPNH
ncbi:MAG: hypothetical protein JXR91_08315 [Deltaproteobacteria bacterium]|nr:hypothetical protein [Deltaproteobacteria bacterium]